MTPKVSIIMGSTSDLPVMEKAAKILDEFEVPFEMNALSAHRTPDQVAQFAASADKRGYSCVYVVARNRTADKCLVAGNGRPAGDSTDASRNPCGHRRYRCGAECGAIGCADIGSRQ